MRQLLRRSNIAALLLGIVWALWLNAPIAAAGEMTMGVAHVMAADDMASADCPGYGASSDHAGQMAFCALACAGSVVALPTSATQRANAAATPAYLRRRTELAAGLNPAPITGPPRTRDIV